MQVIIISIIRTIFIIIIIILIIILIIFITIISLVASGGNADIGNKLAELLMPELDEKVLNHSDDD